MDLTMQERKKLTMVKALAYLKAGKTKKSAMLDDFCASTGYCRRYAARVLHQALMTIWNASTFLGPVRLAGGMLLFVENQKGVWALHLDDEIRRLLLQMSSRGDRKGVQEQEKRVAVVVWWR